MKIKNVYKIAGILILYVVLQSKMNGPGSVLNLQVTGAPGNGTCANSTCHTQGSFNPMLSMGFFENGALAAKWEPGKEYTLRLTINSAQIPERYGFQALALNQSDQQAGSWENPGTGKHVVTLGSRQYVEHSAPLTTSIIEVPWKAPDSGTDTVTFYAAAVAANHNTLPSGDGMTKNTLVIPSANVSSVSNLTQEYAVLKVLPNPVGEMLNLQITNRSAGNYKLRFIKTTGEVAKVEPVNLAPGLNNATFGVDGLTPGLYILQLCGQGQHVAATQMLKL